MAILREAPFSLPGSGQSPVPPRPFLELGAGLAGLQLSKQSAEAAEGLQLAWRASRRAESKSFPRPWCNPQQGQIPLE